MILDKISEGKVKVFNENYFIDEHHCYTNDTAVISGYAVSKTKSPHIIEKENDVSGWFPNIIVAKPTKSQHVSIKGSGIWANNPCKAYMFPFTLYEDNKTIIKLPKAFKLFGMEDKDIYIGFIDLTGKINPKKSEGRFSVGGFPYAGSHHRYELIQCNKHEIKSFFKYFLLSPIKVTYDLKYSYQCCANSDKQGIISPISYEVYEEQIKKFRLEEII